MTTLTRIQETSYWWPLALSTLAGLSTSIGAVIAVIQKPSQHMMSGLLGVAIGVMATVSIVELILRNALEHDAFLVCAAAMGGALAYYITEPFFPKFAEEELIKKDDGGVPTGHVDGEAVVSSSSSSSSADGDGGAVAPRKRGGGGSRARGSAGGAGGATPDNTPDARVDPPTNPSPRTRPGQGPGPGLGPPGTSPALLPTTASLNGLSALSDPTRDAASVAALHGHTHSTGPGGTGGGVMGAGGPVAQDDLGYLGGSGHGHTHGPSAAAFSSAEKRAGLLRLGMLMAVTMTLHNMPEGFAVAFSAFTSFGPIMAAAIALHNIPEGVIIAAPIYAATGSRARAVGIAAASGLSEPLGALLALAVLKPFVTPDRLQYMLACVGGLMLAVCVIELWPEARACKNDRALAVGILLGSLVMGWTLWIGG